MPFDQAPTREVYESLNLLRVSRRGRKRGMGRKRGIVIALLCVLAFLVYAGLYLRSLSSGTALSDARDMVTLSVSRVVGAVIAEGGWGYDDFVTLEKDAAGAVAAITTNTALVNLLSAEITQALIEAADSGQLDIKIPMGDLLGSNLTLGRGPEIPVRVSMMTTSFVRFENDLVSTGINQSRHSLKLVADVDVDLLIPWGSMKTTVETDVLIAETVIVGRVPDTYLNVGA